VLLRVLNHPFRPTWPSLPCVTAIGAATTREEMESPSLLEHAVVIGLTITGKVPQRDGSCIMEKVNGITRYVSNVAVFYVCVAQ